MPKTIVMTVSTNKGGAGKTTTAVHLAAGLARRGRRVLLVDLDRQGHCATFLGRDPAPRLYDLLVKERPVDELIVEARPNLHLLAGNTETLVAQDFARLRNAQADLLQTALVERTAGYDYILFDTPPQGLLQECAIFSAHVVIVPVPVDYPGMDGAAQFLSVVRHLQEGARRGQAGGRAGDQLPTVLVPMFVDNRTSESRYNLNVLQERFTQAVLTPVPVRTRMREAIAEGQTIYEYAPNDDIATIYLALCATLEGLLDGPEGPQEARKPAAGTSGSSDGQNGAAGPKNGTPPDGAADGAADAGAAGRG